MPVSLDQGDAGREQSRTPRRSADEFRGGLPEVDAGVWEAECREVVNRELAGEEDLHLAGQQSQKPRRLAGQAAPPLLVVKEVRVAVSRVRHTENDQTDSHQEVLHAQVHAPPSRSCGRYPSC